MESTDIRCSSAAQAKALVSVIEERSYQDRKWGTVQQRPHEVGGYITIMRKLLSDAEAAWATSRGDASALDELRKVVAVGVACFEQHGVPHRIIKPPKEASLVGAKRDISEAIEFIRKLYVNLSREYSLTPEGREYMRKFYAAIRRLEEGVE